MPPIRTSAACRTCTSRRPTSSRCRCGASAFDLAYSIGVLHHTPNPPAAFARVAETVAPGGKLAIYVYSRYGPAHRMSDALRVVTTRLPLRVIWALAAGAVPLYYLYRLPVVGKVFRLALPISMEPHWRWRWLDTFDWYTPKYQAKYLYPEVFRWFRDKASTSWTCPMVRCA